MGNKFPDWKGLIGGGLIRGFTQFDIDSVTICVSICDCVLLGFIIQKVTQIVRDLFTNCQIVTFY